MDEVRKTCIFFQIWGVGFQIATSITNFRFTSAKWPFDRTPGFLIEFNTYNCGDTHCDTGNASNYVISSTSFDFNKRLMLF